MRIGLCGGSFDPIHYGHLRPVREAREALALDRVIYLPTARSPHKPTRKGAPALARYAMVELALLGDEDFAVSTFELGEGVSYTVDTLEHFHRQQPVATLFLILGSDSFVRLATWRRWRRILELAELAVLERPGAPAHQIPPELGEALDHARVHRVQNTPVAASSTDVRHRLAARSGAVPSQDLRQLVPPLVLDYIAKYDFYR